MQPGRNHGTARMHDIFSRRSRTFWTAVVSGMVLLLIVVAILQYRWTTQVSEAAELRIGTRLESLMLDWHLDFYRELSGICDAMWAGPDTGAGDDWHAYMTRYAEWKQVVPNPDLVEDIFIWEASRPAKPLLLRLDPTSQKVEITDVPPGLQKLMARLQANSSSLAVALGAWRLQGGAPAKDARPASSALRSDPLAGWQFDPEVVALAHPLVHHKLPFDLPGERRSSKVDWVVVVLDLNTIQKRILPNLVREYFESGEGANYVVALTRMGPPAQIIYSSDPVHTNEASADASMDIFGLAPDGTDSPDSHFWYMVKSGGSFHAANWHGFRRPVWFPVIQYTPHDQPWRLVVRHREGPLEATVERVRRRNLEASIVVLALLAASMGLVVVAGHRAQRLAKLEMDFVASVSHELRTPLAVICSAAENLVDGVVEGKQRLTQYGSIIRNQTRQLVEVVDGVLLLARTGDVKNPYELRPLQVTEIIEAVLESTAGLVQSSGFTMETDVEKDLPPVMGDLVPLTHCLRNLVINAVKYSGQNRWIGVRAVLAHDREGSEEVRVSVSDHGIGIAASELPHIFEAFYRSPAATAAQIHGTGLGLPLARSIAQAMGGEVSVESKVGTGSVFTLHLPVTARVKAQSADGASTHNQVSRR